VQRFWVDSLRMQKYVVEVIWHLLIFRALVAVGLVSF
jgi:hypothetical protein